MYKKNHKSHKILSDQKTALADVTEGHAEDRKHDGCRKVRLNEQPGRKIPTGRKNQTATRNQPENKKVFICSPYRPEGKDDEEKKIWSVINIMIAMLACDNAVERGYSPLCPHLYFPYLFLYGDPIECELGLRFGKEWLDLCDEIWVIGDQITEGMAEQIEYAIELGKPMKNVCVPAEIVSTFAEIAYSWSATDEDESVGENPDQDDEEFFEVDIFDDYDDLDDLYDVDDWFDDYYDSYNSCDSCDGCNGCDDFFQCDGYSICADMDLDDGFLY